MIRAEVLHEFQPGGRREAGKEESTQLSWSVRRSPTTVCQEELCVAGRRVLWVEGLHPAASSLRRAYSLDSEVLQAFWCRFEEAALEGGGRGGKRVMRCVCVRESSCLSLFMETGAIHHVPLPFPVQWVWAVVGGILLERQVPPEFGTDGLPTLFTLLHPMGDLCPATFRRPTATAADVTVLGFVSDPHQRVIHSSLAPPLLVCHDTTLGRHSVWAVQPAKAEDIPVHVGTPAHPHSSTATPQHPLSTSAPSRYCHMTPTGPLNTPVEMILTARKQPAAVPDTLKLPVIAQLQRGSPYVQLAASGGKGGGSGVKVGSGRSPFISRLQTPQSGAVVQVMRRSKSLSPPLLARISPFSQTVNSRSWSTFYSEESLGEAFEPLVPQTCLHLLWQEREEEGGRCSSDAASSVFTTSDFTGSSYLAMVLPSLSQLWLLQYSTEGGVPLSFGSSAPLPALQALPLTKLAMVLVMDPGKQLVLYSGCTKVATVDTCSLTREALAISVFGPSDCVPVTEPAVIDGIRDPIEDSFAVVLSSGRMLRCSLQPFDRHPVVTLCLHALRQVLPTETTRELLASFYPSSHGLRSAALLPHLHRWLLACIGITLRDQTEQPPSSPWQRVQAMSDTPFLRDAVPALRLFKTAAAKQTELAPPTAWSPLATGVMASLQSHAYRMLLALHLVYEEMKLNTLHHQLLEQVAVLLHRIASHLGLSSYVDHYRRDFPALFLRSYPSGAAQFSEDSMEEELEQAAPPPSPPHILQWLQQKLRGKQVQPFPVLPDVCKRTTQLIKLFALYTAAEGELVELRSLVRVVGGSQGELLGEQFADLQAKTSSPYERVVLCLVQEGLRLSDLESLPVGVCLPLWDCVVRCQEAPPSSWPPEAYDIIGRTDVAKSLDMNTNTFTLKMEKPEKDNDGMDIDHEVLSLRFPRDLRVSEVRRLLTSSKPVRIALTQKPEVSDHAFIEEQESHLLTICRRTMALPVGRGMFSLATAQPLPTAPLAIPTLNLTGRAPPRNSTVGLEHIDTPPNMSDWAEFHNGAAAGLRIAPGISKLDSTWMVFHSTHDVRPNSYAGFLMALGLQGHLAELSDFHLYDFLQEKHELTVVGLLVGVAAARLGSTNASLYSLLSIYLPPLLPFGAADMEVSHLMQTAAVVGVGLLYLASGNRHLVEVMLREIGRPPGPEMEFAENRESYSLAVGLALGMITLGQGGSLLGLSDLGLSDKLCLYMSGGPKNEVATGTTTAPSNLVLEGDQVNTHVTAPGAIVALGLIYLKTNNSAIATRLDAPPTQYELDSVRSDFLMLRALSRGLIMWDAVEPTQSWIDSHVPQLVHEHAFQGSRAGKKDGPIDYQTISQAYVNIIAGCCLAMGLRYAGTCDHQAYQCLLQNARGLLSRLDSSVADQAGKPCLESCLNAVVLALSVTMCGSGDLEVLRLIRRLHSRVGHPEVHYGSHMATHMALGLLFLGGGRYSLSRSNTAIAVLLCALFPKFPDSSRDNRYHLQALRHLYVLAAKPRVLVTRDVGTGQACSVDVSIKTVGQNLRMSTPCIIPEWASIEEVEVCSPLYWPMRLQLSEDREGTGHVLSKSGTVFVKQRVRTIPQGESITPKGRHTSGVLPAPLSSRYYSITKVRGRLKLPEEELSRDPLVKAFVKYTTLFSQENCQWSQFSSAALLECISQEKMQVLTTYFQLEQTVTKLPQLQPVMHIWQLKLAGVLGARTMERGENPCLLPREYTDSLLVRLKNFVEEASQQWCHGNRLDKLLSWYVLADHHPSPDLTEREVTLLALTLLAYDIPPHHQLQLTPQTTVPELYGMLNTLHVPVTAVVRLLPLLLPQTLPAVEI